MKTLPLQAVYRQTLKKLKLNGSIVNTPKEVGNECAAKNA